MMFTQRIALGLSGLMALGLAGSVPVEARPVTSRPVSPVLAQRADELVAILNGAGRPEVTFAASFRKAVPDTQMAALIGTLRRQLGRATGVRRIVAQNARRADIVLEFEKGTAHARMELAEGRAGQVTGLWIDRIQPFAIAALATLDEVADAFAQLPGTSGFIVQDLEADAPEAVLHGDHPLAIGSAFKLVILAELVRSIEAGARSWDDVVTLDGRERPAGAFRAPPAGTQVTLRELAGEMIRISDNSASDILLDTLGRGAVEAMQAQVGFTHASANVPFLKTMELFKLKGVAAGALGRRYLASDTAGRRALLAGEVAQVPGSAVGPLFEDGKPVMVETLEWFASPRDLVNVMRWFRAHRTTPAGREALRILAQNPGPAADLGSALAYAGYKGGSEPGVLNMTVLIKDKAGRWKVVAASVNDAHQGIDEAGFRALFVRALHLASSASSG